MQCWDEAYITNYLGSKKIATWDQEHTHTHKYIIYIYIIYKIAVKEIQFFLAALPCWLIMPPDFGWCNLHIIHFWLVKSRINKDHRAIGQALRQVCEALRQQPALQHVLVGVHSSQRWEEQGKGGWEADIHVQICSDMFDTFLYISHDVYWCSTLLTYFTNHWVWNGSKYSELPKNGQDALRSWDSEQQRLLGGDGRRGDNEWLPMNLLVGSFVGSFVGLQLLPVNICQQNSFRDWRTWRGEQGTRTGWMPPKCRSHAGRLPSEMLHGVHLGHLWPSVWVRKAQQIGNHLESHGVTIKNWDIYIYTYVYIYMDLLWFKQLLAIGFKLNGCDSLSIIIYTVRDVSLGGDVTFVTHCGHAVMWLSRTWCDFHERTCSDQLQNEVDGFLSGHCSMDIHWLKEMYGNVVTASRAVSSQYG